MHPRVLDAEFVLLDEGPIPRGLAAGYHECLAFLPRPASTGSVTRTESVCGERHAHRSRSPTPPECSGQRP
jgi:hypothetical protein